MCWSLEVSVVTAGFEFFTFCVVMYRSQTSKKRIDREKSILLSYAALSIMLVEIVEVLLWMKHNEIFPILEGIHLTCPTRNANLTRLLPMIVYSQPMLIYWMFGKVCGPTVKDRLLGPKYLAFAFYICFLAQLFLGETLGYFVKSVTGPISELGMEGPQTCTFLGSHGHLLWMVKIASPWWLPNFSVYLILQFLPLFIGLPQHIFVTHFFVVILCVYSCIIYTEGSFEAGSMWCWTGLTLYTISLFEPYLPLPDPYNGEEGDGPWLGEKKTTLKTQKA